MPRLRTVSLCRPALAARRPAIQSAARNAMATSRPYVGRKNPPMRKTSGNILRMRRLALDLNEIEQQQAAANHDGAIGGVECRPLVTPNVEQQKIGNAAFPSHTIKYITQGAPKNQGQRNGRLAIE